MQPQWPQNDVMITNYLSFHHGPGSSVSRRFIFLSFCLHLNTVIWSNNTLDIRSYQRFSGFSIYFSFFLSSLMLFHSMLDTPDKNKTLDEKKKDEHLFFSVIIVMKMEKVVIVLKKSVVGFVGILNGIRNIIFIYQTT